MQAAGTEVSRTTAGSSAGPPGPPGPPASPPLPFERIGRYELLHPIGVGGMGVVFVAHDEALDRQVAIKLVRSDRSDLASQTRILREGRALARLSHPNVVAVHEVNTHAGQLFLVMEYIQGMTLRVWTGAPDPRPVAEVIDMFVQVGRGLAAAHAQGLVHRDLKPDNVLIGADGRARVVDFGLVADPSSEVTAAASAKTPRRLDEPRLTEVGAVPGTPAYMAPEQLLGRGADARSDQFSFCVALFEAVCGERPFPGNSSLELQTTASSSVLRPTHRRGPEWLMRALQRGLSPEPGDRWPDMDALLAVLGRDPVAVRRRRLRLAALLLLVAVAVAAAVLVAVDLRRRWQAEQHEQAAAGQFTAASARILAARDRDDPDAAARTFADFVADPRFRDTPVFARAWLDEAARRKDDDAPDLATAAYAQAYIHARTPEHALAALDGLADLFHLQQRWQRYSEVLATIERKYPDVARTPAHRDRAITAALGRRDVHAARDLLPPDAPAGVRTLLERLALGAPVPGFEASIAFNDLVTDIDVDRDGTRELLLLHGDADGTRVDVFRRDPALTRVASYTTAELPAPAPRLLLPVAPDGQFTLIASHQSASPPDSFLLRPGAAADTLEVIHTWPETRVLTAITGDLDRDGADELYLGTGPYSRRCVELVRAADGSYQARSPIAPGDEPESDIHDLLVADLDGDGQDELIMATGPWQSYDVRVYRRGEDGLLHLVDRDMLGLTTSLATVRRGDERLLAAVHTRAFRSSTVFPADRPYGEPNGVYLLRLRADRLERVDLLPLPEDPPAMPFGGRLRPAVDLDGDGREDLALSYFRNSERKTIFFLQQADGRFTAVSLAQASFLGAFELDGDPEPESLLVLDQRHTGKLWLVGVGAERLPVPAVVDPDEPNAAAFTVASTVATPEWSRARDLRSLGLHVSAADAFAAIARDALDPQLRGQAHLAAAHELELDGDLQGAADHFERAAEHADLTDAGARGAYRSHLRLGEYAEAAAALQRRVTAPDHPEDAELDRELGRLQAIVGGQTRVALTFDRPLGAAWTGVDPLALRRDSASATLDLDVASPGVLAVYPVDLVSDSVVIDIDMTLELLEWSGKLDLELVPDHKAAPALTLGVAALGGGRTTTREFECRFGSRAISPGGKGRARGEDSEELDLTRWATERTERFSLRAASSHALAEHHCAIARRERTTWQRADSNLRALPPGRYNLVLRYSTQDGLARVRVKIHGISVTGAVSVAAASEHPEQAVAHALVEGDFADARARAEALPPSPRLRLWTADLDLRDGEFIAARDALAELLRTSPTPELDAALASLLRRDAALYVPVLRAASPLDFLTLFIRAWTLPAKQHIDESRVQRELLEVAGRIDVAAFTGPDAPPAALAAACTLLTWRGLAQVRLRRPDDARRDLLRALELARGLETRGGVRRRDLQVELAALAATLGDLDGARDFADAALADSVNKTVARDILRARSELVALDL